MEHYQNKIKNRPKGSILIWSVLLGFVLTSVFFFFGIRQRLNIEVQRTTAEILNAKMYLESYADYLEKHIQSTQKEITTNTNGIKTIVTRKTPFIEDRVDFNRGNTYPFAGEIFIEWNLCEDKNIIETGDLKIGEQIYFHHDSKNGENCKNKKAYNNIIGPIAVTDPFQIETLNSPFSYKISEKENKPLPDNEWHMELTQTLEYGKEIKIKRSFR